MQAPVVEVTVRKKPQRAAIAAARRHHSHDPLELALQPNDDIVTHHPLKQHSNPKNGRLVLGLELASV